MPICPSCTSPVPLSATECPECGRSIDPVRPDAPIGDHRGATTIVRGAGHPPISESAPPPAIGVRPEPWMTLPAHFVPATGSFNRWTQQVLANKGMTTRAAPGNGTLLDPRRILAASIELIDERNRILDQSRLASLPACPVRFVLVGLRRNGEIAIVKPSEPLMLAEVCAGSERARRCVERLRDEMARRKQPMQPVVREQLTHWWSSRWV